MISGFQHHSVAQTGALLLLLLLLLSMLLSLSPLWLSLFTFLSLSVSSNVLCAAAPEEILLFFFCISTFQNLPSNPRRHSPHHQYPLLFLRKLSSLSYKRLFLSCFLSPGLLQCHRRASDSLRSGAPFSSLEAFRPGFPYET